MDKFRKGFEKIEDDFRDGHITLRGSCWRCKQLGKIRSASQPKPAGSMTLELFLDQCTAENFKTAVEKSDIQPSVLASIESIKQAGSFIFGNEDLRKAFETAGLGQPDLYLALYRFPSAALGIAGWILTDPISTRYPMHKHDYVNLRLYRDRTLALRDFYSEVDQQIENLIKYGEEFLEAFLLLRKLGVQKGLRNLLKARLSTV